MRSLIFPSYSTNFEFKLELEFMEETGECGVFVGGGIKLPLAVILLDVEVINDPITDVCGVGLAAAAVVGLLPALLLLLDTDSVFFAPLPRKIFKCFLSELVAVRPPALVLLLLLVLPVLVLLLLPLPVVGLV